MSIPSDICTLMWPLMIGDAEKLNFKGDCWLAKEQLEKIKKKLLKISVVYKSLKLLGVLRCGSTSGPKSTAESGGADINERHMRHSSDIWLNLLEGPVLGDVWCCKYRVQLCQLHVIRWNPSRRLSLKPDVFSATALYGNQCLGMLLSGKKPICTEYAASTLEGVLLPDVMLDESAPRPEKKKKHQSRESSNVFGDEKSSVSTSAALYSTDSGTVDDYDENSLKTSDIGGSFVDDRDFGFEPYVRNDGDLKPLPPRLHFPTTLDTDSEIGLLLRECYAGKNVKRCIMNEEPRGLRRPDLSDDRMYVLELANKPIQMLLNLILQICKKILKMTTFASSFLFSAQVLDLKTRELINFILLILGKTSTCGLHPGLPHKMNHLGKLCIYSYVVRNLVDAAVGFLLSLFLFVFRAKLLSICPPRVTLYEMHISYMDWFTGYPAGLKQNEDLNQTFSLCARIVLHLWDTFMHYGFAMFSPSELFTSCTDIASWTSISPNLSTKEYLFVKPSLYLFAFLSPLGASFLFAVLADVTKLVSLQLRFLYRGYARVYRAALLLLGTLWRQFRGCKYNPLRKRVDDHEFRVDKMLMGSFLLTVFAFLFPTLAVYYLYFAAIRVSIFVAVHTMLSLTYLIFYLPVFPVLYWLIFRRRLVGSVRLSDPVITMSRPIQHSSDKTSTSNTIELALVSSPLPLSYMLSDFFLVIPLIMPFSTIGKLVKSVISGKSFDKHSNYVETLAPHLLADPSEPPCVIKIVK